MRGAGTGRRGGYRRGDEVVVHCCFNCLLPSILKRHFQEKSVVPAGSSPVILVMLEMR